MENQENSQNKSTENQENSQIKNYVMMASLMLVLNLIILIVTLVIINSSSSSYIKSFQDIISQDEPAWVANENKQILALDHALNELKEKINKLSASNYNDNIADINNINQSFGIFVDELQNNVPNKQVKKTEQLKQLTEKLQKLQKQLENEQKELQKWQEPLANTKQQIDQYNNILGIINPKIEEFEKQLKDRKVSSKVKPEIKVKKEKLVKYQKAILNDKEALEYLYTEMSSLPAKIAEKLPEKQKSFESILQDVKKVITIEEK